MKKVITLFVIVLCTSRLFAQGKPTDPKPEVIPKQSTIEDLLKRMNTLEVQTDSALIYKGRRLTKIKLYAAHGIILMKDSTNNITPTHIRMDCRDFVDENLNHILADNQPILSDNLNNTDDYGDQIPHFLIKYPASVYVSKSSYQNQVLLPLMK